MNRLFIALPVSTEIVDYIDNLLREENSYSKFKWEKKENIHITLKFLGDTEQNIIEIIDRLLNNIVLKHNSLKLKLHKLGTFNKYGKPFILWFNFYNNELMENLQQDIENELFNIGFKKDEREFNPHVTLLRIKNEKDANLVNNYKEINIEPLEYYATEFYLMKSDLTKNGSVYTKLKTYKLK
ncbi:MAG TPA: RNA 2',3'-cyclic phosphodiesterase [Melioribacteraceae bacterium]|nr:RNA 2',3'-cyclic phosphodiesterase [Melioribacteraceae bacterium]